VLPTVLCCTLPNSASTRVMRLPQGSQHRARATPNGLPGYLRLAAPLHPGQRHRHCYSKLAEQELIDSVLAGPQLQEPSKELRGAVSLALPVEGPTGRHRAWIRAWHALRASCGDSVGALDVCASDSWEHRLHRVREENAGKRLLQARQRRVQSAQRQVEQAV
jgi:hypothetical protein